jgi:hypothetical protein
MAIRVQIESVQGFALSLLNRFNRVDIMFQTNDLFKDLYNERWGDPRDPNPVDERAAAIAGYRDARLFSIPAVATRLLARADPARPNAWSFTIPIDRRLR